MRLAPVEEVRIRLAAVLVQGGDRAMNTVDQTGGGARCAARRFTAGVAAILALLVGAAAVLADGDRPNVLPILGNDLRPWFG
jgi:hypothetical protein